MDNTKKKIMIGEMVQMKKEAALGCLDGITEEEAEAFAKVDVAIKMKNLNDEEDENYRDMMLLSIHHTIKLWRDLVCATTTKSQKSD